MLTAGVAQEHSHSHSHSHWCHSPAALYLLLYFKPSSRAQGKSILRRYIGLESKNKISDASFVHPSPITPPSPPQELREGRDRTQRTIRPYFAVPTLAATVAVTVALALTVARTGALVDTTDTADVLVLVASVVG